MDIIYVELLNINGFDLKNKRKITISSQKCYICFIIKTKIINL